MTVDFCFVRLYATQHGSKFWQDSSVDVLRSTVSRCQMSSAMLTLSFISSPSIVTTCPQIFSSASMSPASSPLRSTPRFHSIHSVLPVLPYRGHLGLPLATRTFLKIIVTLFSSIKSRETSGILNQATKSTQAASLFAQPIKMTRIVPALARQTHERTPCA